MRRDLSRRAVGGSGVGELKSEQGKDESLDFYDMKKPIST